jgi:acetyl-CoA acetyltransferase
MAWGLKGKYAIVGVGQSPIGKLPDSGALSLLILAVKNAVEDAGLSQGDIDGLITRGPDDVYCHHQRIGELLGLDVAFSTTLDNGGASQCLAVALACMAIESGMCQTVVCGYGRNTWSRTRAPEAQMRVALVPDNQRWTEFGPEFGYFGAVATHALSARRHMHLYGTTREQLGSVAVAFRQHAARNPAAQMREPLTLDQYLAARLIVEPFGLYDCSLVTDGAGAVVVTSAVRARDLRRPPAYVLAAATANNLRGWSHADHMIQTAAQRSAHSAYEGAGLGPRDVDTAQFYDCFTHTVLLQLEDYGFCSKGEGGAFAEAGNLALDGSLPANTSGGQLSEGHVEGMLQIIEAVRQVRREYPVQRQVNGAEVALVSGHGGNTVCHSTLILGRSST